MNFLKSNRTKFFFQASFCLFSVLALINSVDAARLRAVSLSADKLANIEGNTCGLINNSWLFGVIKANGKFLPHKFRIRKLKKKLRKLGTKNSKIAKKIKTLRKQRRAGKPFCLQAQTIILTPTPISQPTTAPTVAVPTLAPTIALPTTAPQPVATSIVVPPTTTPTPTPTATYTATPTMLPPTETPTATPTRVPTRIPTRFPTITRPTIVVVTPIFPTRVPTRRPTVVFPTRLPTFVFPTVPVRPTLRPTVVPVPTFIRPTIPGIPTFPIFPTPIRP